MSDETEIVDELRRAWRAETGAFPIDRDEIRMRATKFQRVIRRRNLRELAACVFVVLFEGVRFFRSAGRLWMQIASVLLVLGVIFVAYRILRDGRTTDAPEATVPTREYIRWHQGELERQRRLLADVPRWYLAPLVPGFAFHLVARLIEARTRGESVVLVVAFAAVGVLVGVGVVALNRRGARSLAARIRELDEHGGAGPLA